MKPNKLSDRQLNVIPHLLACSSIKEGSIKADVSTTQIYEWMKNPDSGFKEELERQRNEIFECAVNKLKSGMTRAVDTLCELMDSKNEAIQRGAANDILNHVAKFKDLEELQGRLETIERSMSLMG